MDIVKSWRTLGTATLMWACAAPSHAAPLHYAFITVVGSARASRVSVIGPETNTVTAKLTANPSPVVQGPFAIAITPDGAFAYVVNSDTANIWVIDTATTETKAIVDVGPGPNSVAIAPMGNFVYIVLEGTPPGVKVIDTSTNAVVQTIPLPTGSGVHGIALTPDGAHAYVGLRTSSNVAVIDTASNAITTSIYMNGGQPNAMAVTPDGTRVYVALSKPNGRVNVIDTTTNTLTASMAVGAFPSAIAITPDGSRAYVTNQNSDSVSVIDTGTNTVTATIALPVNQTLVHPTGIAITPAGDLAYVVSSSGNRVIVIDIETNSITTNIEDVAPLPIDGSQIFAPHAIAFTPTAIEMAPMVSGVLATPNPTTVDAGVGLIALVDDSATGSENIVSAEYNVDGGTYSMMLAEDGLFDSPSEVVSASVPSFDAVGVHEICVRGTDDAGKLSNPALARGDGCSLVVASDPYTPPGTDVPVALLAAAPGGGGPLALELAFDSVESAGMTSVTAASAPIDGASETPPEFKVGAPPLYYDVETTATFSGKVTLCFFWEEGQFLFEGNISLFHYVDGAWQLITTTLDQVENKVCGDVDSLSPFAIFERSYTIAGFFQPIDNLPTRNVVKAGAAVPVKFSLGGYQGLNILAAGYPSSRAIFCDVSTPTDTVTETLAASSAGLRYDSSSDTYTYAWKTEKVWSESCRRLTVTLTDGSTRSADFQFKN